MPSILQRLKERKLFQWALAYLAGAWLVFQGIEVLAEPWNLSEAVQRTIHVLLGVGFLVTLSRGITVRRVGSEPVVSNFSFSRRFS